MHPCIGEARACRFDKRFYPELPVSGQRPL